MSNELWDSVRPILLSAGGLGIGSLVVYVAVRRKKLVELASQDKGYIIGEIKNAVGSLETCVKGAASVKNQRAMIRSIKLHAKAFELQMSQEKSRKKKADNQR